MGNYERYVARYLSRGNVEEVVAAVNASTKIQVAGVIPLFHCYFHDLITEEKYSNYQEMDNLALLELSAKEDKALRRFVDKDLKTKIRQYKKKQMRPLLMLDAIMETVKELIMNYSEKHSYLSLAEIAVTGDVTTFQNPEFENTLNSLTLEAKQALIDSLGFESDDELVDYLMNLYDDPFGLDFDAFDDEDDDYDDDEGGSVIFHDFGDDR